MRHGFFSERVPEFEHPTDLAPEQRSRLLDALLDLRALLFDDAGDRATSAAVVKDPSTWTRCGSTPTG